jgi:hypothetical protein
MTPFVTAPGRTDHDAADILPELPPGWDAQTAATGQAPCRQGPDAHSPVSTTQPFTASCGSSAGVRRASDNRFGQPST